MRKTLLKVKCRNNLKVQLQVILAKKLTHIQTFINERLAFTEYSVKI